MKKINLSLNSIEPLIQKISELTKIQRIIVSIGAVVVVIVVFGWLLYKPEVEKQIQLDKEIASETDKLKKTKENAEEFGKYQKLMEEKKVQFSIASKQLPQTDEVPTLLTNISQAGKEAGLSFLLFMPQTEIKKNFYAEIPIKMELSGSYNDLGVFFDRVAGMSRIVNIKNFDVSSALSAGAKRSVPIRAPIVKGKAKASNNIELQENLASELSISCVAETYKFVEASADDTADVKGKKGPDKRGTKPPTKN